ncbi:MAG: hypothetical protein ACUVWX_03865 [Kiritimatiellia bacterium]
MNSLAQYKSLLFLLAGLALVPLMISGQSLWIDEGETAFFAMQPDFQAWLTTLRSYHQSGIQMPLYMFLAWVAARGGLVNEWGLRAQNAFWIAVAVFGLWRLGLKTGVAWSGLLLAVCPFVWTYADEARPYAMHIACGTWLLSGFVNCIAAKGLGKRWATELGIAAVLLSASHLVGLIPVASAMICLTILFCRRKWRISVSAFTILAVCSLVVAALAFYYFGTLRRGVERPRTWSVGMQNVLFCVYEFGGFAAFGPPRYQLREWLASGDWQTLLRAMRPAILPWAALGCGYLGISAAAWGKMRTQRLPACLGPCLALLSMSLAILLGISIFLRFPFWGRYLAALFPCAVFLGTQIAKQNELSGRWPGFATAALVLLLLAGSLNLRWNPRHRKDDYRLAASIAKEALQENRRVWWVASELPARYYRLPGAEAQTRNLPLTFTVLYSPRELDAIGSPAPDLILLSKPSIFDAYGTVRNFIRANDYQCTQRFNAFELYERQSNNRG